MIKHSITLTEEEFNRCYSFSKKSAKTQREYRSGGSQVRSVSLVENDTQRGKVAELIVVNFLKQPPFNIENIDLDFEVYPRGVWDSQDFEINGKKMSIKSAKWFSNWLLLETKDIQRGDLYDYYIFVTINKNLKSGEVQGFATKDEILNDVNTLKLTKGQNIPNTETILDADNHARKKNYLHNSEEKWINLIKP
ncbi:hypothetical protein HOA91_03920 [Candidatus Woesearchaeota archaeon]|jgi:hypothetical protein|nr:hypothetical protein [Candidatus Woesearchaeota archaeon]